MSRTLPPEVAEAAQSWRLEKVDSQRWKITDAEGRGWAPMPRAVDHGALGGVTGFEAVMAPRKVAQEALEAYRRGEYPPCYIVTGSGLVRCEEDSV